MNEVRSLLSFQKHYEEETIMNEEFMSILDK